VDPISLAIGGSALLSGIGGFLGNKAQAKEAQKNRDFQADQSATAHQREVEDLRKAGLNPILSGTGGGGASSPSGATAAQQNPLSGMAEGLQSAAKYSIEGALKKKEMEAIDWNIANQKWAIMEKEANVKLTDMKAISEFNYAKNLEQDWQDKAWKAWLAKNKQGAAEQVLEKTKELAKGAASLEPYHVLRGMGITAGEYFKDAKDWAVQTMEKYGGRQVTPSEHFGKGKGTTFGGQHKAGQKMPWKGVEQEKGSESDLWNPSNWKMRR